MILYKIKKNNKLNLLSKSYLIYLNCYYTNRFSSNFVAKKYLLNEINNNIFEIMKHFYYFIVLFIKMKIKEIHDCEYIIKFSFN